MIVAPWAVCLSLLAAAPEPATPAVETVAQQAFEKLPGSKAFVFTQLTPDGPMPVYGLHENEQFAVGSSFKLFILGQLADDVNQGVRSFDDVAPLQAEYVGPPHSELADWPLGSPVTLHTLALKMISISDNTATDHLHHLLGRERIEAQMARMGHSDPAVNTPLLETREMVMLRDKRTGLLGREYQKLDVPAKRAFLAEHTTGLPDYEKLDFDTSAYKLAEWYASPMDMARTMDWLQRHSTPEQPAHPVRGILAMDTKLAIDPQVWPYAGFKGGSEDQLLAGNWLLQHRNGNWYTFHVACNSPTEKLSQPEMVEAITKIFSAIERELGQ